MAYSKTSNTSPDRDIKYLNSTYSDFKNQLIEYAKNYFPETHTDFSEASPGMMFIEMAAYVGDILSFYQNTQLQETFLLLAQEKENLYNMAYSLGYRPKTTNVAAAKLEIFQLVPSNTTDNYTPDMDYAVTLTEGSSFKSTEGSSFILEKQVNFNVNTEADTTETTVYSIDSNGNPEYYLLKKSCIAYSSEYKVEEFQIGGFKKYLTLDIIESNIVAIDSIIDSDGNEYVEVPYLAQDTVYQDVENIASNDPQLHAYNASTPYLIKMKRVPRRFVTRLKSNNNLEIQFGAGETGTIDEQIIPNPDNIGLGIKDGRSQLDLAYDPANFLYTGTYGTVPSNTTLTVRYRINPGGVKSNVASNTITERDILNVKQKPGINNALAAYVKQSITSTNPEPATGGGGGDTIQDIRMNAMAAFSAQNRTVTTNDYLIRTLSMPSKFGKVAKAYITQDDQISPLVSSPTRIPNPMALNLYTLGYTKNKTLTNLNEATKHNLQTYLEEHRMLTDAINIKNAFVINIQVDFEIIPFKNSNNQEVLFNCLQTLKEFFNIDKWQINQPILISEIYNTIGAVQGVQSVPNVEVLNVAGADLGYSPYKYDIKDATIKGIIYPSLDPSIFEILNLNQDIKGRVTQY
tara:strand:- start:839 stop:2731 length:1893 start_codon:yes stop_codon:yes gene_type:complete